VRAETPATLLGAQPPPTACPLLLPGVQGARGGGRHLVQDALVAIDDKLLQLVRQHALHQAAAVRLHHLLQHRRHLPPGPARAPVGPFARGNHLRGSPPPAAAPAPPAARPRAAPSARSHGMRRILPLLQGLCILSVSPPACCEVPHEHDHSSTQTAYAEHLLACSCAAAFVALDSGLDRNTSEQPAVHTAHRAMRRRATRKGGPGARLRDVLPGPHEAQRGLQRRVRGRQDLGRPAVHRRSGVSLDQQRVRGRGDEAVDVAAQVAAGTPRPASAPPGWVGRRPVHCCIRPGKPNIQNINGCRLLCMGRREAKTHILTRSPSFSSVVSSGSGEKLATTLPGAARVRAPLGWQAPGLPQRAARMRARACSRICMSGTRCLSQPSRPSRLSC